MSRYVNPVPQYLDGAGDPVVNGKLFVYESEQNVLKSTFADQKQTIPNTNPIILDSAGRTPNTFYTGTARIVLQDSSGLQLFERDPVGGQNDFGAFGDWAISVSYDIDDIVQRLGKFYLSKINANQGNDPSLSEGNNANWTLINFLQLHDTTTVYGLGDIVNTSTGLLWASQTASNTGNNPTTDDGTNWLPAVAGAKIPEVAALDTFINKSASFTIVVGESYQIDSSGGAVNAAMPTSLVVGKIITVHNESISTNTVLLTNPSFTIKGTGGTIAPGTDLELAAGDTARLVAKSTLILEVV
jgi:hypothetical protein